MLLAITVMLVLLFLLLIYKPPAALVLYLQHRTPSVLWQASCNAKVVALTIDDGPSESTAAILAACKDADARATHFVIGSNCVTYPATLRKIVAAGHELGNHGLHDEPAWRLSLTVLEDQIISTQREINAAHKDSRAAPPQYYRPGHGIFNTRILARVEQLGYRLVMGGVYPHDAQIRVPWLNAWHIYCGLRPGAIIVCHDRPWTPDMLRILLPKIKDNGWSIVSVTELLET